MKDKINLKTRHLIGRAGIKHTHTHVSPGRRRFLVASPQAWLESSRWGHGSRLHDGRNIQPTHRHNINIMYLIHLSQREFFIQSSCKYIKNTHNTILVFGVLWTFTLCISWPFWVKRNKQKKQLNNRHTFRRWRAHKHIQRGSHSRPWFELGSGVRWKKNAFSGWIVSVLEKYDQ